jgi:GTP-binding protein Era
VFIDAYEEVGLCHRILRQHRGRTGRPQGHGHRGRWRAAEADRIGGAPELETLLGTKVHLELFVKVRSGWADDDAHLRSYGYE